MRQCGFGTNFFACNSEKCRLYRRYSTLGGRQQAGKDVLPNKSAVSKNQNLSARIQTARQRSNEPFDFKHCHGGKDVPH